MACQSYCYTSLSESAIHYLCVMVNSTTINSLIAFPEQMVWKMRTYLVKKELVLSTTLFFLATIIQVTIAQVKSKTNQTEYFVEQQRVAFRYGVVVNCGSSGSRAHIFRWPAASNLDNLAFNIEPVIEPTSGEFLKKSIRPGLSSFKNNPDAASDYMKPIMDFISSNVPREAHSTTPIYFMATAGLRLLSEHQQRLILDSMSRNLKVQHNFPLIYTKVISGVEEGVYQWLSVNAYTNRLNKTFGHTKPVDYHCKSPISRTYAIMEVGGASAQVAYEVTPQIDFMVTRLLKHSLGARKVYKKSQNEFKISQNRTIKLFSTTFLGFGANSVRELAIDLMVRDAIKVPFDEHKTHQTIHDPSITLILDDPCLPAGAQDSTMKPYDILFNKYSSLGYTANEANIDNIVVKLVGKGNYHQCQSLLNRLIVLAKRERLNCNSKDEGLCSSSLLGTIFIPFKYYQFLGFGELFYATKEMINADGLFNGQLVMQKTIEICSTPYEELLTKYPEANRHDSKRVLLECFKASWILAWLFTGLNSPRAHRADLTTVNQINGNDVDWSLGAILASLTNQADTLKGVGLSKETK